MIRAVRFDISAEYEAVQLYMQLADSTDDKVAQAVLRDVAEEEIVHAGEFLRLLKVSFAGRGEIIRQGIQGSRRNDKEAQEEMNFVRSFFHLHDNEKLYSQINAYERH